MGQQLSYRSTEKDFKIPTQPEKRERVLRDLIRKRQKPIALFIDDAHDLHAKTLVGLKRLTRSCGTATARSPSFSPVIRS